MAKSLQLEGIKRAAKAIAAAKALYITAGAGMGVDSGLPDFRGSEGFWKAYPPLKKLGVELSGMSNPQWFEKDPEFAWGFFGHRYHLYTSTEPHHGFQTLRQWGSNMELGCFVYTSNVDGHFQKAGFSEDQVCECHGSINFMQCTDPDVSEEIWPVSEGIIQKVDIDTLRMQQPLPKGPPGKNSVLARPNILMFGDWYHVYDRTAQQENNFSHFQDKIDKNTPFVVVEIGAGTAVPTIRYTSERLVSGNKQGTLIRINPNEPQVPSPKRNISLPIKGLEALNAIDEEFQCMQAAS